jgi:hypothetical protein
MEPRPVAVHLRFPQLLLKGLQCKLDFKDFKKEFIERLFYRSSNFKRQNTIDAASIKENTARLASQNQRPISAQPKSSADSGNTFIWKSKEFSLTIPLLQHQHLHLQSLERLQINLIQLRV